MALVAILKDLHFKKCVDTEVPLELGFGISMSPKNGIKLTIVSNSFAIASYDKVCMCSPIDDVYSNHNNYEILYVNGCMYSCSYIHVHM